MAEDGGVVPVLEAEIEVLKEELNKLIENGTDELGVYDLSVRLDQLIVEYYRQKYSK